MKKKLLIFHPAIGPYRISFFNDLAEYFDAKICCYYRNLKDQKLDFQLIRKQLKFEPEFFQKELKIRKRLIYIGHISRIRKYKPDLVMTGEYGFGLWCAVIARMLSRRKFKIVTICDDSQKITENCSGMRKKSRDVALKLIDGVILCDKRAAQWYSAHSKASHFYFPILQSEEAFYKDREEALQLAKKYSVDYQLTGKRVFLFVGRLAPEKNLEYLVRSFIEAHTEHPENVLFLVGGMSQKDITLQDRLEKLIQQSGAEEYICFTGRKDGTELRAWYYVSQVFVLPSTFEPFGAVVNEALLAGEYVMVSNVAGSASIVDETNGEIIDISKQTISFDAVSEKIAPLSDEVAARTSRMMFTYREKMDELLAWMDERL